MLSLSLTLSILILVEGIRSGTALLFSDTLSEIVVQCRMKHFYHIDSLVAA